MDDALALRSLGKLLDGAHLATPDQLPAAISSAAAVLGWSAWVYLADYEQVDLVPFRSDGVERPPQPINTTLAGRAFQNVEPVPATVDSGTHLWVPLIDGVERLGVLDLGFPDGVDLDSSETIDNIRWFAHLAGHLIAGKGPYGDSYHRVRSQRDRGVASELIWAMLPPLTTAANGLVISAILEPAHEVAGDVFDYSVDAERAHFAIIDATGHDLHAGVIGAVALASYRTARRHMADLATISRQVDSSLSDLGLDTYATAAFGSLDLKSGQLDYVNAGHLAPLLLRNGKVVKSLDGGRRTLLGLRPKAVPVASEMLEPGDWIILYTDGVTEARDDARMFFGLDRFIDTIERCAADGRAAPETLRRVARAVLDHHRNVLQDDATLMIVQWETDREEDLYAT